MKWHIPFQGQVWLFDDEVRMTVAEARLQKRHTNGLAPMEVGPRRDVLDPDAWVAALLIAMRRAGHDGAVTMTDLEDLVLADIMSHTLDAARAELDRQRSEHDDDARDLATPAPAGAADEPAAAPLPAAQPVDDDVVDAQPGPAT